MKRILLAGVIALAPVGFAFAADDAATKPHPPEKAMDQATPQMKNPDGTDKMHAPQKAMDQATPPAKTDSVDGAGSGTSGSGGATYNADEANKASDKVDNKQKIPSPDQK